MTWELSGALGGTRTPSLLIRSQMLYPLSYERRCRTVYDTSHYGRAALIWSARARATPKSLLGAPRRRVATCGVIAVK